MGGVSRSHKTLERKACSTTSPALIFEKMGKCGGKQAVESNADLAEPCRVDVCRSQRAVLGCMVNPRTRGLHVSQLKSKALGLGMLLGR